LGKCVVRQSGVVPFIHSELAQGWMARTTPFEDMMIAKVQASRPSLPCFVDPRTGLHCVVAGGELRPFPLFDVVSKEDQVTRRGLAQAALTAVEMGVMKGEGYRLSRTTDEGHDEDEEEGWGEPALAAAHMRRLREIRHTQESTHLAFEPEAFSRYMHEEARDHAPGEYAFTAEAMECLQTCVEHHLVGEFRGAYAATIRGRRIVLSVADLFDALNRFPAFTRR
jgi:histone H3/H4